ncbi:MAG TPA: alcohol dehydrogenase catalytic domain-containing protein [Candidatus Binataceae bacterium]|nr:alcohol dehydrogenase catalytic domain-containing protein [Candidatus Binataceae bacterium]
MRAIVLKPAAAGAVGRLSLCTDYPRPRPGAGESLVRVRMAGICGTDLEQIRGYMGYSGVPGHEFVGEVVESANDVLMGRRVVGEINAGCGVCQACRAGLARHCPTRTVLGILGRDGAFADYLCLPDVNLRPVPDTLSDQIAVFTEPLAAALEIFSQTTIAPSARVAILGDGRLGAMVGLAMAAHGLNAVVGGHHKDKLERLARMGLAVEEQLDLRPGFDVVVDCTGSAAGVARGLALVRPRGKLILKTTVASYPALDLAPVVINEVELLGSRCGEFEPALELLASGRIDPGPLIAETFALSEGLTAFELAAAPATFKVLLSVT